MTRVLVLSAILALGLSSVALTQATPPPAGPDPANFTGKVTGESTSDIRLLRYAFEPAARTNWHRHEGGQVIVVERGRLRLQQRGGRGQEFKPRETYVAPAGVEHWHGALPGESLTQVSLSYGATTWLEPVTDQQYAAAGSQ